MLTPRTESELLSLAASAELSENSRLGFGRKNRAPHLEQEVCNSTTALGIERGLLQNCIGSRIQTWNRYAYVANNPTGAVDPLGLDEGQPSPIPWGSNFCGGDPIACALGGWDVCVLAGLCSPNGPGGGNGGSSGGGGSQPSPPPSNPPSNPPSKPVNFPNETLGIPNRMNVNFGGPLGAILPAAICGDMGPCPTIGSGFAPGPLVLVGAGGETICLILEPCGAGELIFGGLFIATVTAIDTYQYFAKGGTQNVAHDYVRQMARQMPGDYCSNLKTIMDNARKSGNSKLFNDAKATWKQDCRGR